MPARKIVAPGVGRARKRGRRLPQIACLLVCCCTYGALAPAGASANRLLGVGYNEHFALGLGYHNEGQEQAAPVQLPEAPAAFTAGEVIGGALLAHGELVWWGGNQFGQAGSGRKFIPSPFPSVIARGVTQAVAGNENGCAVNSGGQVLAWGTTSSARTASRSPAAAPNRAGSRTRL